MRRVQFLVLAMFSLVCNGQKVVFKGITYMLDSDSATVVPSLEGSYAGIQKIPSSISHEGKTYRVTCIGSNAFKGCSSLKTVAIPSSVKEIRSGAFTGCTGLKKAEFESVEALCSILFRTESSNPMSCTHNLIVGGEELTEVSVPEGVTHLSATFAGLTALTSVTLPQSLTSISAETFAGCTSLKSVKLPSSLRYIGTKAFSGCTSLSEVRLPETVTMVGRESFSNTPSLKDFYCVKNVLPRTAEDAFDSQAYENTVLHVSAESVEYYREEEPWCGFQMLEKEEYRGVEKEEYPYLIPEVDRQDPMFEGKLRISGISKATGESEELFSEDDILSFDAMTKRLTLSVPTRVTLTEYSVVGFYLGETLLFRATPITPYTNEAIADLCMYTEESSGAIRFSDGTSSELWRSGALWAEAVDRGAAERAEGWEKFVVKLTEKGKVVSKKMIVNSISSAYYLLEAGGIYDLSGRQLQKKPTKGIYIQNGKKVLSK